MPYNFLYLAGMAGHSAAGVREEKERRDNPEDGHEKMSRYGHDVDPELGLYLVRGIESSVGEVN